MHESEIRCSLEKNGEGQRVVGDATDRQARQNGRRLLTYSQLASMGIKYSREHLWRLEAAGKFPRRLYLSPQKVVWFEHEVFEWLDERAADRHSRIYRVHE
jgi:prophage regulatory protein